MRPIFPIVDMCRMSIGCWNRSRGIERFIIGMAVFVFLSVLTSVGAHAVGEVSKPPEKLTSTPVSTEAANKPQNEVELQRLHTEIKQIIGHEKEINEQIADIKKTHAEYVSATAEIVNANKEQASRVVDLMMWFLTALLVILAFATAYGLYEVGHLRRMQMSVATTKQEIEAIKLDAKADADHIKTARLEMERFYKETEFIVSIRHKSNEQLRRIPTLLDQIQSSTIYGLVGVQESVLNNEMVSKLHDVDVVLVVSDQIGLLLTSSDSAKAYIKAAQHWRLLSYFARAKHRAERAIELDPSNVDGYIELSRVLSYWATEEKAMALSERVAMLQSALTLNDQARATSGKEDNEVILHDRGWIYDSLADCDSNKQAFYVDESIACYRRAIDVDNAKALLRKREPTAYIRYNYLCELVKGKLFTNAIDELRLIANMQVGHYQIWQWVEKDPQLKPLLESQEWSRSVKEILDKARGE